LPVANSLTLTSVDARNQIGFGPLSGLPNQSSQDVISSLFIIFSSNYAYVYTGNLKYEGQAFAMIFRRLARPITILLAKWCFWQIFRIKFSILIPVIKEIPVRSLSKIAVAANALKSSTIHQALQTHKAQNNIHSYTQFTATSKLVGDLSENNPQKRPRGAWSKPAYLLSIIVAELA
jgi:hypothetical protein